MSQYLRYPWIVGAFAWLLAASSTAVGQPAGADETASDKATGRVQALLVPRSKAGAASITTPQRWPGVRAVEQPQLPIAAYTGLPPQPPVVQSARPALPRTPPETQPPIAQGPMPKPIEMPTKPVIQLPAADVEAPLPIPIVGQPKQDRASLDDTTLEASQAAALVRVRPRRPAPVPFTPLNLPDPFENQRQGGLRNPPAEGEQPPAVPIRTPGR
jgi:hypothetical protein